MSTPPDHAPRLPPPAPQGRPHPGALPVATETSSGRASWRERLAEFFRVVARGALRAGERLPRGIRLPVGISLMIGGLFGFLPVLGFWMIPAGIAIASLDIPPLRRRVDRWLDS